MDFATKVLQLK